MSTPFDTCAFFCEVVGSELTCSKIQYSKRKLAQTLTSHLHDDPDMMILDHEDPDLSRLTLMTP